MPRKYRPPLVPNSKDLHLKCLCCHKHLKYLDKGDRPAHQDVWDNCIVSDVRGGFGSLHDMSLFIVGICDGCISNAVQNGTIVQVEELSEYLTRTAPAREQAFQKAMKAVRARRAKKK